MAFSPVEWWAGGLVFAAVMFLLMAFQGPKRTGSLERSLARLRGIVLDAEGRRSLMETPGAEAVKRRLEQRFGGERLNQMLVWSGGGSAGEFLFGKAAAAGGVLLALFLTGVVARGVVVVLLGIVAAGAAWWMGDRRLLARISARRLEIRKTLPLFLDQLHVATIGGYQLPEALAYVSGRLEGLLAKAFQEVADALKVHTPEEEAWRTMAERYGFSEGLRAFVFAYLQAKKLGTPLGEILRVQANEAREEVKADAMEVAKQASVKAVPILLLFVFGPLVVLMVGTFLANTIPVFQELRAGGSV